MLPPKEAMRQAPSIERRERQTDWVRIASWRFEVIVEVLGREVKEIDAAGFALGDRDFRD